MLQVGDAAIKESFFALDIKTEIGVREELRKCLAYYDKVSQLLTSHAVLTRLLQGLAKDVLSISYADLF